MSTPEMLGVILAGLAEVHEKLVARARDAEDWGRRLEADLVEAQVANARMRDALDERQQAVENLCDVQRDDRLRIAKLEEALKEARQDLAAARLPQHPVTYYGKSTNAAPVGAEDDS